MADLWIKTNAAVFYKDAGFTYFSRAFGCGGRELPDHRAELRVGYRSLEGCGKDVWVFREE